VAGARQATLHLYPGTAHYFADPGYRDYDAPAAALLTARVRTFLRRLDAA
jgi:dienelactone hydrolase